VEAAQERNEREVTDTETGRKVKPAYTVEVIPPDESDPDAQLVHLSQRVRQGELHGVLVIGSGVVHPRPDDPTSRIAYYSKNPALDELRKWANSPVNTELRRLRLADAGIAEQQVADLFVWLNAEPLGLVSADPETGQVSRSEPQREIEAILLPLAMPMVMFLLIMMGAMPQLTSVTEEKSQRIAEVMLGSLRPFPFMLGKLIGGVGVALTAATVYVLVAILSLQSLDLGQYIPYQLLPWFFAYLIAAIFMFGAMFAALGSACNDAAETQSIVMPAMLPIIFPFFVQMPVVTNPDSLFATSLSLFPICTPMLMLLRQGTPNGVPLWQSWVGLAGVLLTTVLFVWVAGRIFRIGILTRGTPPRWANIARWALRERP
jgi:ABC-2 type transport system permease protein